MSNAQTIGEVNILTGQKLKQITPSLKIDRANKLADSMAKILPVYGMYNKDVLPEFIAQLAHESIEFSAKTENMNYSADALVKTWPSRFTMDKNNTKKRYAPDYARQPQKIANAAYNGRMNNRIGTDDGWNFRGSGFLQLTGRDSVLPYFKFKQAGKGYKFEAIPATPEELVNLLRTNDEWALDSACWEFAISKGLIDEAIANNFYKITQLINGGQIGAASRQKYYKRALQVI